MLNGKKIIVGVTGGIAAYKSAVLVRLLKKAGAEVRVLMTQSAKQFVQPLTFATLSQNPVFTEFHNPENGDWHSHVKLALWADLIVIAPATANTIAKLAYGIADNLLLTTCLSSRSKIMVAPAMDFDMYAAEVTQLNLKTLQQRGFLIVDAEEGELASGLSGKGRMAEPEQIFNQIDNLFAQKQDFVGKRILLTAGPTIEKIDPVRFISNYSTGKMGYAIAEELANRGAEVLLVSGKVQVTAKHSNIKVIPIESAQQMYEACVKEFPTCDCAIMAAAVADFTPSITSNSKIKKNGDAMTLTLESTKDIAAELGKLKTDSQLIVGFALETDNELDNARHKLESKNMDFIVLNSLKDKGAGFGYDTNKVTIVMRNGEINQFDLKPKSLVAQDIANTLKKLFV